MNDTVKIKQGDEEMEVSLADIAGIDMNAVEAHDGGFEPTPKGVYRWEVKDAGLDSVETKNGPSATIYFELECQECYTILGTDEHSAEDMQGWMHKESIFVGDLQKSVGQAKAIMQRAGFTGSGSLTDMLDAFCGSQFISPVSQRKDKNDTDRVYANIVVKKITPVPNAGETQKAAPSLVG